jgi:hypothetical protein
LVCAALSVTRQCAIACTIPSSSPRATVSSLTPKERDAHTTLYVGLLKQGGTVVEGRKLAGAKSGATRQGTTDPHDAGQSTATRQAAKDLGVSDDTVCRRVRNTVKLAARNGVAVDKPTPEGMKAEEMIRVGKEALKIAEADREEAKKTNKAPGHVNPMQPLSSVSMWLIRRRSSPGVVNASRASISRCHWTF